VSPYLDNAALGDNPTAPSFPFYTLTQKNKDSSLPPSSLNFYDYSQRSQGALGTATPTHSANSPITWSASLYPVIADGNTLTVENGIGWGWTLKKAMVGSDTGTFVNPMLSSSVVSGVGTSNFSWGIPDAGDSAGVLVRKPPDTSSLSFSGGNFDAQPNQPFKLGTLTYHNGTTRGGEPNSVEFDDSISFDNVPENNLTLKTIFDLVNTTNTSDPIPLRVLITSRSGDTAIH
jgi:hypothetical protein